MATLSTLAQAKRRKQATYGKASRNVSGWNMSLDALEDHDVPAPKSTATVAAKSVKEIYHVQKQETKPHAPKPSKPRTKKQDSWDVPSSDEEEASPVRHKSPPKVLARRKLVSRPQEKEPELAPWEKSKVEPKQPARGQRPKQYGPTTADDQLMSDLARSLQENNTASDALIQPAVEPVVASNPVAALVSPKSSSSVAKLRAKKLLARGASHADTNGTTTSPNQKRAGDNTSLASSTPRKRAKTESLASNQNMEVAMDDAPPVTCAGQSTVSPRPTNEMDIYDFPESSADELITSKPNISPRKPVQKTTRRGKMTTYSSPRKMESAPARLSEMLPPDTDTTDTTTRSPSMASRPTTPRKSSSASKAATPETALRRTPKPAQQWDRLLTSDETTHGSPSALPMQDLTLNSRRQTKAGGAYSRPLARAATDLGRQRPKLVDCLKASAPSSDDETSDQDDGDQSPEDVDMDASDAAEEPTASQQSQSLVQSQSQNSLGGTNGPKVYARVRSYIVDDSMSIEDPLDIPGIPPPRTAVTSRGGAGKRPVASQKSAFDLEDSEDEDDAAPIKSIHELRAGGDNQRFLDSLGGLLEDIADHNISARSRRRSALMELATKLVEPTFLERFFRHGYEQQLLAECSAAPDAVSDFTLASIFVTIAVGEPSNHAVKSLKDGEVLSWLGRLLSNTSDPKKLARDRSANMSKSAQTSFVQFVGTLAEHEKIWEDNKPSILTPRTLAMKAYDVLIRKLRVAGDTSELVDVDILRQIAPTDDELSAEDLVVIAASTSALESLSTNTLSLAWPLDVIERVRDLLVSPLASTGKIQTHLRFLTLRLCTSLTVENARNCKILARQATMTCLLQTISNGFGKVSADEESDEEERKITLDLVFISLSIMTNLVEHSKNAAQFAATSEARPLLGSITDVFRRGQERLAKADAKELEGMATINIAYGYLAAVLADLCRNPRAKDVIVARLPGGRLNALVDAVEEWMRHHKTVDAMNQKPDETDEPELEGKNLTVVWSAYTQKLKGVWSRLKAEAEAAE